jgi:short-chain fatty acids transporter
MNQKPISDRIIQLIKKFLPHPFTIAILITILTFGLALLLTRHENVSTTKYAYQLILDWQAGLWDKSGGGLYFAFQMMLMLVLGHCLALTDPVKKLINQLITYCTDTPKSALIVAFSSIAMGLFNWGLGLIFGAILARRIGEKFSNEKRLLNYGLIGASAYLGLMVWHGGLSGSAPTKAMEFGALQEMTQYMGTTSPLSVPFESTIGSTMNLVTCILLLILLPLIAYFIGKKSKIEAIPKIKEEDSSISNYKKSEITGAERLDYSQLFGIVIGLGIIGVGIMSALNYEGASQFGFIEPNFINFILLGLTITLHKSIYKFLEAVQNAIGDVSGILIQFPLYFGILGIMKSSGLIVVFSDVLIELSDKDTLPLFTFISAGLVNFFVPSGGGQWAIQGPVILQSVQELGANLPKTIMAMAYGDQLTNMLQPFWALPLLGITRLKAQDILPYTFIFFLIGLLLFGGILILF